MVPGQQDCDRCSKLRKDCTWRPLLRRSKARELSPIEKVEQKVDKILAIVNSHPPKYSVRQPSMQQPSDWTPSSTSTLSGAIGSGIVPHNIAEELLQVYKDTKMLQFPFVIIPPFTSARFLEKEQPFVFLSIMAVTVDGQPDIQKRLKVAVKEAISQRAVMSRDFTLDFLQGLIIYIAWLHRDTCYDIKQVHVFLQLADLIATDLGVHDFPIQNSGCFGFKEDRAPGQIAPITKAGCRAYLGYFYLNYSLTTLGKRSSPFNPAWVDYCSSLLAQESEHPTDTNLKMLVDICSLNHRIRTSLDSETTNANASSCTLASRMLGQSFQTDANHIAEICFHDSFSDMHELALQQKFSKIMSNALALDTSARGQPTDQDIPELCNLLKNTKTLLEYFVGIPLSEYPHITFPTLLLPWQSFVLISCLIFLPSSEVWDRTLVKAEARLHEFGSAVKSRFDALADQYTCSEDRKVWSDLSHGVSALLQWHETCEQHQIPLRPDGQAIKVSFIRHVSQLCSLYVRTEVAAKEMAHETPTGSNCALLPAIRTTNTTTNSGVDWNQKDFLENFDWQELLNDMDTAADSFV